MDCCDVFINRLNSHFDGTHSLQRGEGDVMLHFSKSVQMKIYFCLGWPEDE